MNARYFYGLIGFIVLGIIGGTGFVFASGSVSPAIQTKILASSPVCYYPMQERSGTTLANVTGNTCPPISLTNATVGVAGPNNTGSAVSFSSASQSVGRATGLNTAQFGGKLVIEFIGFDGISTDPTVPNRYFVDLNNATSASRINFYKSQNTSTYVSYWLTGPGSTSTSIARYNRPDLTRWHHYVVVYDSAATATNAGKVDMYIDGVKQTKTPIASNAPILESVYDLWLGLHPITAGAYTDMNISHLALYKDLSEQAIADHAATLLNTALPTQNALAVSKQYVKIGQPTTITVTAKADQTVTLSDGGAGGVFSSGTLALNSGNSYTGTIQYTPTRLGMAVVSATFSDETKLVAIMPQQYSGTIGFIGDSLTSTNIAADSEIAVLGSYYRALNKGKSGSTTDEWATSLIDPAVTAFSQAGVEVVQIMLGTNDVTSTVGANIFPADTKRNLQTIITKLKTANVKKIIINKPPYFVNGKGATPRDMNEMLEIQSMLDSLMDGQYVFIGDEEAFTWYQTHQDDLVDGVHMTVGGYTKLGQLWAAAYSRVIH